MKKDNNFLKIYCLKNAMNYLKEIKLQFILKLVIFFLIMLVPMKEFMIFLAQQHYTNNLLQMEFAVYEDFDEYISL